MLNQVTKIRYSEGFSLIELAIVLVIVGVLIGSVIGTLGSRIENTKRSVTIDKLSIIRDAIIGFASSNGRIPCPAKADSEGEEAPVGGGVCDLQHGFVPMNTLGLRGNYNRDILLLDSWDNPIRYSVTTSNANAFTTTNGMSAITMTALTPDLIICTADSTSGTSCAGGSSELSDNVPFVILSLGKMVMNLLVRRHYHWRTQTRLKIREKLMLQRMSQERIKNI